MYFAGLWTLAATDTSGGSHAPMFSGEEGKSYDFYVLADDAQGNHAETGTKQIVVPWDDDNLPSLSTTGVTSVADSTAYGGGLTVLPDTGASLSFLGGRAQCTDLWLIGPGTGTWTIELVEQANVIATIDSADVADGPRQVLWKGTGCAVPFSVKLVSGSDAAIDAVGEGPI